MNKDTYYIYSKKYNIAFEYSEIYLTDLGIPFDDYKHHYNLAANFLMNEDFVTAFKILEFMGLPDANDMFYGLIKSCFKGDWEVVYGEELPKKVIIIPLKQ